MILQALYEYYQRKAADPESGIAPRGYEHKEIPFIIVIDRDGKFVNLEDTAEPNSKNKRYGKFLVLKTKGRSGAKSYETANVLWDHYGYVLSHPKDDSQKAKSDAARQNETFTKDVSTLASKFPDNEGFMAVLQFLKSEEERAKVKQHPSWADCIKKAGCNMSFRLVGEKYIVAEDKQLGFLACEEPTAEESCGEEAVCLITGVKGKVATLHTATSIPGGKSGAKLVGFQKNSGYDSYYKEQGANAPVSVEAEDAYTTALNVLLGKDSANKIKIGDTSILFWAEKPVELEEQFAFFFSNIDKDNPDRNIQEVRSLYESVHSGKLYKNGDTGFYILGLAPNAARISVRLWKTGTVKDVAGNIMQHFDDLKMVRSSKETREFLPLYTLLSSISMEYKLENLSPNIIPAMTLSVIDGTLYPATVQQQCLRRIRAEQSVTYSRVSILKAYLNRKNRILTANEKEITMALDKENKNQGYLCGRLFAVLEKVQEDALPGLNTTIKDRFYGAASATPVTVFGRLIKLSSHHIEKLSKGGKVYYERILQEIIGEVDANGMPAHLSLDDQSRFAIGYYHQRQELFTAKKDKEENVLDEK